MDILVSNILGAGAFILTCIALYILQLKKAAGWIIFLPSYCLQMLIFYYQKQWFLLFQMVILFFFSILNYLKWEESDGNIKNNRTG